MSAFDGFLCHELFRDFGIGLSPDDAARVDDRFWRADEARTQGGTGLGLAIARELVSFIPNLIRLFRRLVGDDRVPRSAKALLLLAAVRLHAPELHAPGGSQTTARSRP